MVIYMVLKTDINMGVSVDLSYQPAFCDFLMPRYNFLGASGGRDRWFGLEADGPLVVLRNCCTAVHATLIFLELHSFS